MQFAIAGNSASLEKADPLDQHFMTDETQDARRFSPPAQRNREPIAGILRKVLPQTGTVLHIAEGSGEHVVHFAKSFPHLTFQPSDPDPQALESIAAWIAHQAAHSGAANILAPLQLDASSGHWPLSSASAVICINMIHISPWAATEGLMRGAARILEGGSPLFLYGPYKQEGRHTAPSNEAFDQSLRQRNGEWGIRDLADVAACARSNGFGAPEVFEMPANNLGMVFKKA